MRNVLGLSVVLLMCAALSSCSGNKPEKGYMGTWKGTIEEGEPVELSFMEKGIFIVKIPDKTVAGTWTMDPEGNAQMTYEDGKIIATSVSNGRIIARAEDGSGAAVLVLERTDAENKK